LIKDALAAFSSRPLYTSKIWTNCSYNETNAFSETWDTPDWNLTRWALNWDGFGPAAWGFLAVNKLTNIPGLGNWTNIERASLIPNTTIKATRFTSSKTPCAANPSFCVRSGVP